MRSVNNSIEAARGGINSPVILISHGFFKKKMAPSRILMQRRRIGPSGEVVLAFLRWQFELTSPIIELFAGGEICFSTKSFSPLAE
jgi:hypothetical protein